MTNAGSDAIKTKLVSILDLVAGPAKGKMIFVSGPCSACATSAFASSGKPRQPAMKFLRSIPVLPNDLIFRPQNGMTRKIAMHPNIP
jgi:hypothetical protein